MLVLGEKVVSATFFLSDTVGCTHNHKIENNNYLYFCVVFAIVVSMMCRKSVD